MNCALYLVITLHILIENTASEQIIPVIITIHPDAEVTFVLHTSINLSCQASGYPAPSYYWTKDNHKLDANLTSKYTQNNGDLVIHEAAKDDEGIYYCWAWNKGGTDRSLPAVLSLAFLEPFPFKEPEVRYIDLGSSVLLKCKPPPSHPDPELMWYKKDELDNMRPFVMDDSAIQDTEGNLHFMAFHHEHSGVYICICFNRVLRNQVHDHVIELYPKGDEDAIIPNPVSLEWSSKSPVTELTGRTLRIQCIFGSYPPPYVSWERVDANLPAGRHELIRQSTTLVIKNLQLEDSGTYECIAFNADSVQPVNTKIQVLVEAAPELIRKPTSVNVTRGGDVAFECIAQGQPSPDISWYVNWKYTVDSLSHMYITNNEQNATAVYSILHIKKTKASDTVVISCVASNIHGHVQSSAYLSITGVIPVIGSNSIRVILSNELVLLTVLLVIYVTSL